MSSQMITALFGVFATLCGIIIGGLITYFTNRDLKRKEWELSVLREEINDRKRLYSEFLAEAYINANKRQRSEKVRYFKPLFCTNLVVGCWQDCRRS